MHPALPDECPRTLALFPTTALNAFIEHASIPARSKTQSLKACIVNTLLERGQSDAFYHTAGLALERPDWYAFINKKALNRGITPAAYEVAYAYLYGRGVEKDTARAAALFLTFEMLNFHLVCDADIEFGDVSTRIQSVATEKIHAEQISFMYSFCEIPSEKLLKVALDYYSTENPYRQPYISYKIASYLLFERQYAQAENLKNQSLKEISSKKAN
jgi:hypothetical protein